MDCGDPFLISMADVTIKDIAEATGVSYATVSRTLNSRNGVSPKTREKVLQTAKEMGYKPNIHARSLKTNPNTYHSINCSRYIESVFCGYRAFGE